MNGRTANKMIQGGRDATLAGTLAYALSVLLNNVLPEVSVEMGMMILVPILGALSRLMFNWAKHNLKGPFSPMLFLMFLLLPLAGCASLADDTLVSTIEVNGATLIVGATTFTPQCVLAVGKLGAANADITAGQGEGLKMTDRHDFNADLALGGERSESTVIGTIARETVIEVYQVDNEAPGPQ